MRRALTVVAALSAVGAAIAQPPGGWVAPAGPGMADYEPPPGWIGFAPIMPPGADRLYGIGGRLPDAKDFAAGYGCRPIWNAKTGRLIPSCNR